MMARPDPPLVPKGRSRTVAYWCVALALPLLLYKVYHRFTGAPIDYVSRPVLIMAGMALFGIVVGFSILGVSVIRSAYRQH